MNTNLLIVLSYCFNKIHIACIVDHCIHLLLFVNQADGPLPSIKVYCFKVVGLSNQKVENPQNPPRVQSGSLHIM